MRLDLDRKAYMIDLVAALDLTQRSVWKLYDAARAMVSKPLCLSAAEKIIASTDKGDVVLIITGFPALSNKVCETDGPLGATVLASTLKLTGRKPIIVTDDFCVDILRAVSLDVPIVDFPREKEGASLEAKWLLSKYSPSTLIAVERPGWNKKGEYHNIRGFSISHLVGKTDFLFHQAEKRGIATIAVGDGGNELGCGAIADVVRKYVPYGARCQCPCSGGIATVTPADVLVIGGTSNWASYGIAACLCLLENLKYKHNGGRERKLLRSITEAGAIDGITGNRLSVDGLTIHINSLVVELIFAIANARNCQMALGRIPM